MFNPIMSELVTREQTNDRLREAGRSRLAELGIARQPIDRFNLPVYLGNRLTMVAMLLHETLSR